MLKTWHEIDKSESDKDSDKERRSFSCFVAVSNEVAKLNLNFDSCNDQFDMPFIDELSYAFIELHNYAFYD